MSHLESELRNALAREEPSDDFAERVLQALPSHPSTVVIMPARERRPRAWLAVAAALVVGSATLGAFVVLRSDRTEITSGVTNSGGSSPKGPIFEGGRDRPVVKPEEPAFTKPPATPTRHTHPAKVRRVSRTAPATAAATREEDAQAYLAARQLRLALTITSEKLRVAQRGVVDRSEIPAG